MTINTTIVESLSNSITSNKYPQLNTKDINSISQKCSAHVTLFPAWMTVPFSILLLYFNYSGLTFSLKSFTKSTAKNKHQQYMSWKDSNFLFKREFALLIESLVIFYYFNLELQTPNEK
ncbi:hypothetical protein DID80_04225 [Candidatus Marinamargulisbacteria bacterium SCGC AAA071-K20]|nr:hypothetical protein DID80_04225 [Candidatus Marinamargulisbacteria bacterium SCGC AAA071-K20]